MELIEENRQTSITGHLSAQAPKQSCKNTEQARDWYEGQYERLKQAYAANLAKITKAARGAAPTICGASKREWNQRQGRRRSRYPPERRYQSPTAESPPACTDAEVTTQAMVSSMETRTMEGQNLSHDNARGYDRTLGPYTSTNSTATTGATEYRENIHQASASRRGPREVQTRSDAPPG